MRARRPRRGTRRQGSQDNVERPRTDEEAVPPPVPDGGPGEGAPGEPAGSPAEAPVAEAPETKPKGKKEAKTDDAGGEG